MGSVGGKAVTTYQITNTVAVGYGAVQFAWFTQQFGWQSDAKPTVCSGSLTGVTGPGPVLVSSHKSTAGNVAQCTTHVDLIDPLMSAGAGGYLPKPDPSVLVHKDLHAWGSSTGDNVFSLKNR